MFKWLCVFMLTCAGLSSLGQSEMVLSNIRIYGNRKTVDQVILRELSFEIGDTISSVEFENLENKAKKRLEDLGLFNVIEPAFIPKDSTTVDFRLNVVERWYLWPTFMLELADPNFNVWWETKDFSRLNYALVLRKYNFRGRNENLYFKFKVGYTNEVKLAFTDPNLFALDKFGIHLMARYKQREEVTVGTKENKRMFYRNAGEIGRETLEIYVRPEYRPSEDQRIRASISYSTVSVADSLAIQNPNYFGDSKVTLDYTVFGLEYHKFNVNQRYYPLHGNEFDATIQTGLYRRSALQQLTRAGISYHHYGQLSQKWFWAAALNIRADFGGQTPYYFYHGLGYSNFVRGYEYYINDVRQYGVFKANLKYELLEKTNMNLPTHESFSTPHLAIYLNAFLDLGYTAVDYFGQEVNPLSEDLLIGAGLGLDFVTFYDKVIRFELSANKKKELGFFLHFTKPI